MSLDLATKIHFHDGKQTFQRTQDCTPIHEMCKAKRAVGDVGSKDMKLAASLPYVVVENYLNINNVSFSEFMKNPVHVKRMLSDPDLSGFRIWQGKV